MKPIFVGGCGRSGTTLLAAMLAAQPGTIAPPEAQFFLEAIAASRSREDVPGVFADHVGSSWRYALWQLPRELPAELARGFAEPGEIMTGLVRAYARAAGSADAERWVDHTPINVGFAATLFRHFPGAPLLHIVRDPRAVVASVLPLDWGPASARAGARWWLSLLAMGLAAEASFPGQVVRVHYERLVRDPAATIEQLCGSLGLDFEPERIGAGRAQLPVYTRSQHALVDQPPDPSRIDAWREKLTAAQITVIEAEVRDVAAMLGYAPEGEPPAFAPADSSRQFLAETLRRARQRRRNRSRMRGSGARPGRLAG